MSKANLPSAIANASPALVATAVQTASYTAVINQLIPCDATSAVLTVTLPAAPIDKSRVEIKKIDATTNTVTLAASGSDVFNKASGVSVLTLSLLNQAVTVQYASASAIWYVVSDSLALSQLDTHYSGSFAPLSRAILTANVPAASSYSTVVNGTTGATIQSAVTTLAGNGGGDFVLPAGYLGLETGITVPAGVRLVLQGTPSQELATELALGTVLVPVNGYSGDLVTLAGSLTSNQNTGGSLYGGTIDAGTSASRALHVTGTDCWAEQSSLNGGTTATITVDSTANRFNWVHCWASNFVGSSSAVVWDLEAVDAVLTGGRMKAGRKMFNGGGAIVTGAHLTGGDSNIFVGAPTTFSNCYFDSATNAGNALITHNDSGVLNSVFTGCRYHQASGLAVDIFQELSTTSSVNIMSGFVTSENSTASRFRSLIRYSAAAVTANVPAMTTVVPPTIGSFTGTVTLSPQGQLMPYQTVAASVTDGATTNNSVHITTASSWPAAVVIGQALEGSGIPSGTVVVSIDSTTQITMSAQATATTSGLSINFLSAVNPAFCLPLVGQGTKYHPGSFPSASNTAAVGQVLTATSASAASWSAAPVTSVASKTGIVSLVPGDVGVVPGNTSTTFAAGNDQRISTIAYGLDYTGNNPTTNTAILTALLASFDVIGIPPAPAGTTGYIALSTTLELSSGTEGQWLFAMGGGPVNEQGSVTGVGITLLPGTGFTVGSYSAAVVISSQNGGMSGITILGQNASGSAKLSYACVLNASQVTLAQCAFIFGTDTSLYDTGVSVQTNLWHCAARNSTAYSLKNNSDDWLVTNWRSLGTRSFSGGGSNVIGGHFTSGAPYNTIVNGPIQFSGVYFDSVLQSGGGTALISNTYSGKDPSVFTGCKFYNNSSGQSIDLFSQTGNSGVVVVGGSVTGVAGNTFKALINGTSGNGDQFKNLTIDGSIIATDTIAAYFPAGVPNGGYDFYVFSGSGHHSGQSDNSSQVLLASDLALTTSSNNTVLSTVSLPIGVYRLSAIITFSGVTTAGNLDVGFTTSGSVTGLTATTVRATANNPLQAGLSAQVTVTAASVINLVAYPGTSTVGATAKASPTGGSSFTGATSFSWTRLG